MKKNILTIILNMDGDILFYGTAGVIVGLIFLIIGIVRVAKNDEGGVGMIVLGGILIAASVSIGHAVQMGRNAKLEGSGEIQQEETQEGQSGEKEGETQKEL